jgi:ABC-2 type transport system ATP-binding protein
VIGKGKLIADSSVTDIIARSSGAAVRVRTPSADELALALAAEGGKATADGEGVLMVQGLTAEKIGDIAFDKSIRLHELTTLHASLEEAFMELTADSVEFQAAAAGGGQ